MLDETEDNRMPVPGRPNWWGQWSMLLSAVEGLSVSSAHGCQARRLSGSPAKAGERTSPCFVRKRERIPPSLPVEDASFKPLE